MNFIIRSMKKLHVPVVAALCITVLLYPIVSMLKFLVKPEVVAFMLVIVWCILTVATCGFITANLVVERDIPAWQRANELIAAGTLLVFLSAFAGGVMAFDDIHAAFNRVWFNQKRKSDDDV